MGNRTYRSHRCALGAVTTVGEIYYSYDGEGRVCAVQSYPFTGGVAAYGYLYDAEGTRVAKGSVTPSSNPLTQPLSCDPTANGFQITENYVLGPSGEELTMLDGNNNWLRTNVYAGSKLLATADMVGSSPALHFHLEDPLGTRRMQLSGELASLGQPETDIQSLPFGDGLNPYPDQYAPATADDSTPLYFTGKERDAESGNDYFGARYYASTMGRFLSPDDGRDQSQGDPQSWNLYGYARNNPLTNSDPDGHECIVNGDGSRTDGTAGGESCADVDRNNAQHPVASVVVNANGDSDNGFEPGSLAAGVFGRAQNSTWKNAAGVVNAAASAELMAASVVAPELLLEDTELLGLGLETEATQNLEIVAADGTKITGYTSHGVDRAIGEGPAGTPGVRAGTKPKAILDALKNPKSIKSGIDKFGRPFKNFIGQDAKVTVNPSTGKIVSVNPLSGAGAR